MPESLQEQVLRLGSTVVTDFASQFVDLVAIRTPPRYDPPTPRLWSDQNSWRPKVEWGENHLLPRIQDSGRWENIPICKPTRMTYPDEGPIGQDDKAAIEAHDSAVAELAQNNKKKKTGCSCMDEFSFQMRGGKTAVSDGHQKLL